MEYTSLSKWYYKDKEQYEQIYSRRFQSESTTILDFQIGKYQAFFLYNREIVTLLSSIYKENQKLLELKNLLPPIALEHFQSCCLIDEIKLTNEIEGIHSTRKEISTIMNATEETLHNQRLFGLVKKYQLLDSETISITTCMDIRNIYNDLVLTEVSLQDKDNYPDGVYFRQNGVNVYNEHMKCIHRGLLPESKIISYMDQCLAVLNDPKTPPLIGIAFFHYMFGYIHPFYDGNGRTSRFISSYLLSQTLDPLVSYHISYTLKGNIKQYYRAFEIVNDEKNRGDITPFLIYFLEMLQTAITNIYEKLYEKREKLIHYTEIIETLFPKDLIHKILSVLLQNALFGEIGISIHELSVVCDCSDSTIRKYMKQFNNGKMLRITQDGKLLRYDLDLDTLDLLHILDQL